MIYVSIAILAAYVIVMCSREGIPYSVSDTYYKLKNGWIFTLVLWAAAFILLPTMIIKSNPDYRCFAFLACAALCFVAAAPNFKIGMDRKVHIGATIVCALSAMTWVALHVPMLLLLWFPCVIGLAIKWKSIGEEYDIRSLIKCKPLFWIEVTAFVITYLAVLIV